MVLKSPLTVLNMTTRNAHAFFLTENNTLICHTKIRPFLSHVISTIWLLFKYNNLHCFIQMWWIIGKYARQGFVRYK